MNEDIKRRASALMSDSTVLEAVALLKAQAAKEVLNAPTDEECVERRRDYRALERLVRSLEKWAKAVAKEDQ